MDVRARLRFIHKDTTASHRTNPPATAALNAAGSMEEPSSMTKSIAIFFGIVYTLVGLAGFIPALGGSLSMAPSPLLGLADVNLLHNFVHLIIGVCGLTMANTEEQAGTYCKTFGVVLLLIGILGFIAPNPLGILPIGGGDIWIHLVSGAILAYAGFAMAPSGSAATTR